MNNELINDKINILVERAKIARDEYLKCCDDYFSMFGYKVNRLGTPHLHVRTYYDYCKTFRNK